MGPTSTIRPVMVSHVSRAVGSPNPIYSARHGADQSHHACILPAGKVLPLNLTTPDGVRLGAWQVLPKTAYDAHVAAVGVPDSGPLPRTVFDLALTSYPVTAYFHGNAGSRAQSNRLRVAQMVSAMDSNFLIIVREVLQQPARHDTLLLIDSPRFAGLSFFWRQRPRPANRRRPRI